MGGDSVCKGNAATPPQIDNQQMAGKACGQESRPVEETKGSVQQLLVKHTQHLTKLLTPELEKTKEKEEQMVKELEQVEQEGKAYRFQLKGIKEQYSGRLGQISGFLGLNSNK